MMAIILATKLLLLLHRFQAGVCFHSLPISILPIRRASRDGGSHGITLFASSSSKKIDDVITQTDVDAALHQTLKRLGVKGIASSSNRRGVSVCTTSKSVAGRGAFWSPSAIENNVQNEEAMIQQGDILAYIPKASILTLANPASLSPSDESSDKASLLLKEFSLLSGTASWPVACALFVGTVSQHNEVFREWIESFMGPEPPICPPQKETDKDEKEQTYDEAAQGVASMSQVSRETAREAMAAQYNSYKQDWTAAQEWMNGNNCVAMNESQFAKLYSILVSRTANLGPMYQKDAVNVPVRGVIPLHDMINHPPPDIVHNVELFTVGDLRELLPEERVLQLVGAVFQHDNELDDKDILLVARQDITPGDELFLSYRNNRVKPMEEKERAWTTLQYGFLIQ